MYIGTLAILKAKEVHTHLCCLPREAQFLFYLTRSRSEVPQLSTHLSLLRERRTEGQSRECIRDRVCQSGCCVCVYQCSNACHRCCFCARREPLRSDKWATVWLMCVLFQWISVVNKYGEETAWGDIRGLQIKPVNINRNASTEELHHTQEETHLWRRFY